MIATAAPRLIPDKQPVRAERFPSEDRNLADKLAGRRICIVIDDKDYVQMREIVAGVLGHATETAQVTMCGWTSFLLLLPSLQKDLVVVLSPRELVAGFAEFEKGLAQFRRSNPGAVVVMNNLHSPASPQACLLKGLCEAKSIDHIEQGFTYFPKLIHHGVSALEAKV
ncbi:MAG: hypothetical protein AB1529_05790 [Candidatus Micrarchaeota archaeon]